MKEEIKNLRLQQFIKDFNLYIKQCYHVVWSEENIQKVKTWRLQRQKKVKKAFIKMSSVSWLKIKFYQRAIS